MMSTKMKAFVGVSPLCLGRAIVPRPHLYWSGYETTCSRGPALLKQSCQLELFCLLDASTTLISQQKDKLIQANKVLCEVYTMSRPGVLGRVHTAALMCMLHKSVVCVDLT